MPRRVFFGYLAHMNSNNQGIGEIRKLLSSGGLVDKISLGFSGSGCWGRPNVLDLYKSANLLFAGNPRSGKSVAANHALLTHYLGNGDHSLYILMNPVGDLAEYSVLSSKSNVLSLGASTPGYDPTKDILTCLNDLSREFDDRVDEFRKTNAANINDYDARGKTKLSKIVVLVENPKKLIELHLGLARSFDESLDGAAWRSCSLNKMLQLGRSYGFKFFFVVEDLSGIPRDVVGNFGERFVFRSTQKLSCDLIGHSGASSITLNQEWRSYSLFGETHFPIWTCGVQKRFLRISMRGKSLQNNTLFFKPSPSTVALSNLNQSSGYSGAANQNQHHKCFCGIVELMRFGCKCGGR